MRDFTVLINLPLAELTCAELGAVACAFGATYVEAALGHAIACEWRDKMMLQFAAAIEAGTAAGLKPDRDEPPSWYFHLEPPSAED